MNVNELKECNTKISFYYSCQGEGICTDVTISNCDLEDGSLIDSLDALDSIMCQDLCHSFSNCHFFRFEKSSSEENCQLFESSYRESCEIVAAPVVSIKEVFDNVVFDN